MNATHIETLYVVYKFPTMSIPVKHKTMITAVEYDNNRKFMVDLVLFFGKFLRDPRNYYLTCLPETKFMEQVRANKERAEVYDFRFIRNHERRTE